MSAYVPRKGDRVRVVLEGEVTDYNLGRDQLNVRVAVDPYPITYAVFPRSSTVSVERLPDLEPEWQPGDVVLDGEGRPAERERSDVTGRWWWRRFNGAALTDGLLPRPVTLLVRDGKPVQP